MDEFLSVDSVSIHYEENEETYSFLLVDLERRGKRDKNREKEREFAGLYRLRTSSQNVSLICTRSYRATKSSDLWQSASDRLHAFLRVHPP